MTLSDLLLQCISYLNDMIWKFNIVTLDRLVLCLVRLITIDHFEKDWVREFTHGIVGSFGGQMLVQTGKIQHNIENERKLMANGKLIGIIEDEWEPGTTLP